MTTGAGTLGHGAYDNAIAIEPIGAGRYRGAVPDGWEIEQVANGGLTMAIGVRAVLADLGLPDPLTATAHFLRPPRAGLLEVAVTQLRRGRRHGTATARVVQDGRDVLALVATAADLKLAGGPARVTLSPPALPPPEQCRTVEEAGDFLPRAIAGQVEMRVPEDQLGFVTGRPSGEPTLTAWLRFVDDRAPDAISLPLFSDVLPPSSANLDLDIGRAPTVELTVHVRHRPVPGWLRGRFTTATLAGGYLAEDGELWDADGQLVAQSRQLALAPRDEP